MIPTFETFVSRAEAVRAQIATACVAAGREPAEVELLAVTKTHGPWAPAYSARFGLRAVGENRVQEAVEKIPQVDLPPGVAPLRWELIGDRKSVV